MSGGRLSGRTAIVTGAASGIGRATAQLFAAEGARVLAVDLPDKGLGHNHADDPAIVCFEHTVAGEQAAEAIVARAMAVFGHLDIVVNNAGISTHALLEAASLADFDRTIDVNLRAHFLIARQAIPHLKLSPAGRLINVASVMAEVTDYGLSAYCASKAGVAGLTRSLALELGKFGITANYVLPGAIATGMTEASFAREDVAEIWARKSPLRRLGQPIDVARGILFLASDDGGFVTGHGLHLDGGMLLRA
jgi:3-oxoacyl-[acyl-carrier protein] reductase